MGYFRPAGSLFDLRTGPIRHPFIRLDARLSRSDGFEVHNRRSNTPVYPRAFQFDPGRFRKIKVLRPAADTNFKCLPGP